MMRWDSWWHVLYRLNSRLGIPDSLNKLELLNSPNLGAIANMVCIYIHIYICIFNLIYIYIYLRAAAPAADPGKESGIAGVQKRCGKIRWSTLFFLDFALQLFEKVKQYLTKYTWRRWLLGLRQMPQCSNFFKGWWNRQEPCDEKLWQMHHITCRIMHERLCQ